MSAFFAFILVLGVLVFVHELGHYLAARFNGVKVEAFAIGFGPEIWGWHDRAGTRWKVCWIPLGGYVKMLGDANAASVPDQDVAQNLLEEDRSQALPFKSVGQRIAIALAGPIANYALTFVLMMVLFSSWGVRITRPIISEIDQETSAYTAGMRAGDQILSIDSIPVKSFEDVVRRIQSSAGKTLQIKVVRGDDPRVFSVPVSVCEQRNYFGTTRTRGYIGLKASPSQSCVYEKIGIIRATQEASQKIVTLSFSILNALSDLAIGYHTGSMGGPLTIAKLSGQALGEGGYAFLWWMAILSLNLGLFNLLPIPLLDGGHVLLYTLEGVLGRSLAPRILNGLFIVGGSFLAVLIGFSFWNDIHNLKIITLLKNFFS